MNVPYFNHILNDISDGLILISGNGIVLYINPSAKKLLGNAVLKDGVTYAQYMAADESAANDPFHQYVLDCIYEKNRSHNGTVTYTRPDGIVLNFNVNASYVKETDDASGSEVILRFSDVTELHKIRVKQDDSIKVLIGMIAIMAFWDYLYAVWKEAGEPISTTALTVIAELIGVAGSIFALRFTSITFADFGLGMKSLKKSLSFNTILTLIVIGVMITAKFLLRLFLPESFSPSAPFLYLNVLRPIDLLYIPTVVIQEFLMRGVTQGSLQRVIGDKYPSAVAIIVTSLLFGSLHIHKGLMYMVGSALLISFFGIIYRRQGSVWGLCIPHLVLSWSLRIIWGSGV